MNPFDPSINSGSIPSFCRGIDRLRVHPERWFDSLRSLTIVLSVVEARLEGAEG